ncbi:hypothetical protein AAG906_008231 [Vitis piasezkii]
MAMVSGGRSKNGSGNGAVTLTETIGHDNGDVVVNDNLMRARYGQVIAENEGDGDGNGDRDDNDDGDGNDYGDKEDGNNIDKRYMITAIVIVTYIGNKER